MLRPPHRSSAFPLLFFLTWAAKSDAIESTKFLRRECAATARAQGRPRRFGEDGNGACGVAMRSNFADAGEVEVLRSMSAMTAERAETGAALAVYEFESNGITHGDRFATFGDKLRTEGRQCCESVIEKVGGGQTRMIPVFQILKWCGA